MFHRSKALVSLVLTALVLISGVALAAPGTQSSSRKLNVTFLFHANQNLVPYGKVGDRACFRGLIRTLLKHPHQKFQLHFSAPLIHDLQWFGDSTLQLIRQGINAGQFEIFGSTYAQNIMYSTRMDTGDYEFNDYQIRFQKRLIEKVFGVAPRAFWNAERVWTQNFVNLLVDNGYLFVPVEDHILLASGATGSVYQPRRTMFNNREVVAFEDDKTFLGLVDDAINTGNPAQVMSFLHDRYADDTLEQAVIGYYQDAEATGLWDFEGGIDPQTNFTGLDVLLSAIDADTTIRVTSYEEWIATHPEPPELTPIVDGAAQWMGGDAWFTENQQTEFQAMRSLYNSLRNYIDSVSTVIESYAVDTAANKLIQHAWFTLCAHQFEFGCHGLEGDAGHTQLQLARASAVGAAAALYRLMPDNRAFEADINRDGVDEVVLTTPNDLYVLSSSGGRLLYWFDLGRGEELVGNENFSADYGEAYTNDNHALPVIRGGIETYPWLAGNAVIPEIFTWNFIVRKRALNDQLGFNGGAASSLENLTYDPFLDSTGVTFIAEYYGIHIRKEVHRTTDGLDIQYTLASQFGTTTQLSFEVQNSFSPSLLSLMDNGRKSVEYVDAGGTASQMVSPSAVGVRNNVTGSTVRYSWSTAPEALSGREDVFGLELNPSYAATLGPGDSTKWSFALARSTMITDAGLTREPRMPAQIELYQNYPNPFNPTTGIRYQASGNSWVRLVVYDILGREVAVLVDSRETPGEHEIRFDGSNLSSGVYFYKLTAGNNTMTKAMVLQK